MTFTDDTLFGDRKLPLAPPTPHRHAPTEVGAGVFDAGAFTFTGNLTVEGTLDADIAAGRVTPGTFQSSLDFRFPSLMVGDKAHESPVAGYIHTAGTLSGINMEDRSGTSQPNWVMYPTGGVLGFWTGGTGAQGTRINFQPSGLARFGVGLDGAYIGEHPIHVTYAGFGHVALENVNTDYCLLQNSSGTTVLNSSPTTNITLRVGGTTKLTVTGTALTTSVPLTVTGGLYADNAELYRYDSTYAGFRNKDSVGTAAYQILMRNTGLLLFRAEGTDSRILMGTGGGWYIDMQAARTQFNHQVNIGATNRLSFNTYGGGWFMQDSIYIRAEGNKNIYTAGQVRGDNALVTTGQGVYFKAENDHSHRLYYQSSFDGCTLQSWTTAQLAGVQWDTCIEAGRGGHANRHVNRASSVWRYSDAAVHTNMSDPRFKRNLRQLPRQVENVRGIKPIEFQWDEKHDTRKPGSMNFGFSADDLPEEVTHTSFLINEETGEPEEVKMMDPVGVLAMLWEAFVEEAERADRIERRVTAIENLPAIAEGKGGN